MSKMVAGSEAVGRKGYERKGRRRSEHDVIAEAEQQWLDDLDAGLDYRPDHVSSEDATNLSQNRRA